MNPGATSKMDIHSLQRLRPEQILLMIHIQDTRIYASIAIAHTAVSLFQYYEQVQVRGFLYPLLESFLCD